MFFVQNKSLESHNCDHNADCLNNEGSFECQCKNRYRGDGRTCEIILVNECRSPELNTCNRRQRCVDKEDGYDCICLNGFDTDGADCVDRNECITGNVRKRSYYISEQRKVRITKFLFDQFSLLNSQAAGWDSTSPIYCEQFSRSHFTAKMFQNVTNVKFRSFNYFKFVVWSLL